MVSVFKSAINKVGLITLVSTSPHCWHHLKAFLRSMYELLLHKDGLETIGDSLRLWS